MSVLWMLLFFAFSQWNSYCLGVPHTCPSKDFTCQNGNCINNLWLCDGYNDCGDNSDELECGRLLPFMGSAGRFQCQNGVCVPSDWRCDGDDDCGDNSDEGCLASKCTDKEFRCRDGTCISKAWVCDRERDCQEGSDEDSCRDDWLLCRDDELRCKSSGHWILRRYQCDGDNDCGDWEDELGCGEPLTNCNQFVTEGENFKCECESPPTGDPSCRLSWPGHTEGPVLNIPRVRRQDNGTQFICKMDCDGTPTTTTAILNIAYGPSADGVRVTGPASFVTDGTRPLTLACEAGDVNPQPAYWWRGMKCENGPSGSTCVLTPKHWQDGKDVECRVTNVHTTTITTVSAVYRLNLSYPPPSPPRLSRSIVEAGVINCTVTGGKPPVSSVQFSCSNNTWPDQPDTTDGSTVTSSLVLVNVSEGEVRCQCSAEWEPQPELYRHKQDSIIPVMTPMGGEPQGPKHEQTENGDPFPATIGGAAAGVLVVIGIVVFVVIFVRKKTGGRTYERPLPRRQEDITVYQGIISPQLRQLPDVQTNRNSENYEVVDVTPMQVLAGNPRGVRPPSSSPPASPPEDSDCYLEPNPRPPPRF